MIKRALPVLLALVVTPAALAHGGGDSRYHSTVSSIKPAVPGLAALILGGDDQIRVTWSGQGTLFVSGYEGEPYLRFDGSGVAENVNSPARYLNEERFGAVDVPASASAKAPPEWQNVSEAHSYEWHDHRIHWMSPIPPPKVKADPEVEHHIFTWSIPARAGAKPVAIAGTLTWEPSEGGGFNPLLLVPLALAALAAGVLFWRRVRNDATRGSD